MKNGNCPCRSTPAEVVSTKRLTLRGVAANRLRTATKSLCSGPLSPSHLPFPGSRREPLGSLLPRRCNVRVLGRAVRGPSQQ